MTGVGRGACIACVERAARGGWITSTNPRHVIPAHAGTHPDVANPGPGSGGPVGRRDRRGDDVGGYARCLYCVLGACRTRRLDHIHQHPTRHSRAVGNPPRRGQSRSMMRRVGGSLRQARRWRGWGGARRLYCVRGACRTRRLDHPPGLDGGV